MQLRSPFRWVIISLLVFVAPCLWAHDGLRGTASNPGTALGLLGSSFGSKLVAADFDNDQKPDGALLFDAGTFGGRRIYRIELHLSAGENRNLTFTASDPALTLSAQDVNRDGIPDLIVEQVFTHKRIQVWLNDGHGRFRQARVEDFSAAEDAPCRWRTPNPVQVCLILGLPSRFETHHAAQLLEVLRFDSSSSHWRVGREARSFNEFISISDSPRAPPISLPL